MTAQRIYKPGSPDHINASATPAQGHPERANGHPDADSEDTPKPFPLHCLPEAAEAMAAAITRTERTPESLAGCCVLGILSASIGAGLEVRSGANRVTRGNLYLLASAESGSGKSETFRHAVRPFQSYERELLETWRLVTGPRLETEQAILEARIAQLVKQAGRAEDSIERGAIRDEIEKGKAELAKLKLGCAPPALCCEDTTTEKLAVMLRDNREQIASLSADAGSVVNNLLGRYTKLSGTDESIYLRAWSGDFCRTDRQGKEPIVLQRPCAAALWLTQPDKIESLLAEQSLTDGGLIPRILVCHTNARPIKITDDAEGIPPDVADKWERLITGNIRHFRLGTPITIDPTPEARELMKTYFNGIVERRLADLQDVGSYAARWAEQAWRIAVCLHAGHFGSLAAEFPLDEGNASRAVELAQWFAGEQLRILAGGRHEARQALRDGVLGLLVDKPAGIRAEDVYKKRIVQGAREAHALLEAMAQEALLTFKESTPDTGGHITRIYSRGGNR